MNSYSVYVVVKDSAVNIDKVISVDADTPELAKEKCGQAFRKVFCRDPYYERYEVISKPYLQHQITPLASQVA